MTQPDKFQDRQKLANLITQWNQDHYDLFELCAPNEALEFHGVVRFYFQDEDHNVVTKCIRVASSATTREVVSVLVDKFRPDMRMLGYNRYNLFEVHINGEERQLLDDERVLYAQLGWGKDVREGRFLLRKEGATAIPPDKEGSGFKRKLSKREKKEKKRQDKEKKMNKENVDRNSAAGSGVAEQLYTDAPETSFTRSISNPEAVMRRRREQKLQKKLQQFHGQNGQGGTLKIYGETLKPDVPYKTLLLSTADTVRHVIREAMEKYGIDTEDTSQFVLVEVLVPQGEEFHGGTIGEERILDDNECPLTIAMQHPPTRGMLMFQLKRKNADQLRPKNKRQRAQSHEDLRNVKQGPTTTPDKLPFLLELNPDGTENLKGKVHRLHMDVTEVGSEKSMSSGQHLQLHGPSIQPRHCVITHIKGIISVTPTSRDAETYVNNKPVYETTLLQHGASVVFGKTNAFRFFDPVYDEKVRKVPNAPEAAQRQNSQGVARAPETNFDTDGRVETVADGPRPPHPQRQESRQSSVQGSVMDDTSRGSPRDAGRPDGPKLEEALPAALEFRDERENEFLSAVILDVNTSSTQFKLSSTYTLYLAVRYRLSAVYRPDLTPSERAFRLTTVVNKIAQMVHQAIQDNRDNPATLAFWMANASEILHYLKQDRDVHPFSQDSQEMLAEAVQMAFHHLVRCLQYDLQRTLPAFLDDSDNEHDEIDDRGRYNRNKPSMADILDTLSSAMNLLRRCRVNAALTIQLFSQLFHFVNMWVFNILVTEKRVQLCTRLWGVRLKRRLGRVEAWAEKQGLELAADCHLCRIIQAAHLLQAPKSNPDDIANISSTCFKLNSLQLRELLQRYIPEPSEPPIPQNLIERVVSVAENMADELIRSDGRVVQLEEDQDLQLPFLLPEDGYSCDTIKGVPSGLAEYVEPLTRAGLCRMTLQPQSKGYWTVYMTDDEPSQIIEESIRERRDRTPEPTRTQQSLPKEPEIICVTFNKVKGSMGLSIVAAKGDGQRERGIYIKSVVHEGAAAIDGRLQAGDQLLEVDGKSLVGLTQEKAAELMTKTGHTVELNVAKQGAIYHGLATLLSQPSPVMQRASPQKTPTTPSKQRPGDEGPPPYNGVPDNERARPGHQKPESRTLPRDLRGHALRGPDSRSSPALNSESGLSAAERLRVPSAASLRTDQSNTAHPQPQQPIQPHGHLHRRDNRDLDKSKSIPNLRMDNSVDSRPDPGMIRPAQSVSALQQQQRQQTTGPDYYNQPHSLDESRTPDYENQPLDPRLRGYPNTSQPSPVSQYTKPHGQQAQGTPSRAQQNFERPQSQYFGQQDRSDHSQLRPKSEEITPERLQQWQDSERSRGAHDQSFDRAPNYSNIRPQANYANQGEIRKMDAGNQPRQPNFYENTIPRQQDAPPPFQQLRRPPGEGEKPVAPKPAVPVKPNQPLVQPAEIPRSEVDNRQTQPHFYNVRPQDRPVNPNSSHNYNSPQNDYQNTNFHDGRITKLSPGRDINKGHDFPSPPHDVAPELPPPPSMDDVQDDDLPPLPPPPVTDYRLEQKIREEQNRLLQQQQMPADPSYSNLPPSRSQLHTGSPLTNGQRSPQDRHSYTANQSLPPQSTGHQPPHSTGYQPPSSAGFQSQQPQSLPAGYQPSHDYQNINYPGNSQTQQQQQNLYETYDTRRQQQNARPAIHKGIKDQRDAIVSPWNREERERQQKQLEDDTTRQREAEISELGSRPQRTTQEEERLRKLRLDQEFQRRLQEVADKDEEDDSDGDDRPMLQSRMSVQTMQEDLVKSRMRMQELEQKRQYDEMEKEKDRMERLERKMEVFERERDDQKKRLARRSEKQQHEQDEYLRKQREARDKHKAEIEENIRVQRQEDEKLQQRKLEEERRRKEMEKQRLAEIAAKKEAEEAAARAEIRRQEEEYARQRLADQERRRRDEEREIRVAEERKRLETMANQQTQNQNQYYQQYANLPPQPSPKVMMDPRYNNNSGSQPNINTQYTPPPPERGSSYNIANSRAVNSRPDEQMDKYNGGYRVNNPTAFRSSQENIKKVSFNPQMPGQQGQMGNAGPASYNEPEQQSPPHSYQPFQRAYVTPDQSYSRTDNTAYSPASSVPVNSETTPSQGNTEVKYRTIENTPNVIGAQEIYRDPRSRIEAKMANKGKQNIDRLSFRDKMKFFAQEAGENTPINKPKASTTQRRIESQLHNGQ